MQIKYSILLILVTFVSLYQEMNAGIWIPFDSADYRLFRRIKCADSLHCMVEVENLYCRGVYLFATNDGFNTWHCVYADTTDGWHRSKDIYTICYPSPDFCLISLDSGLLIKSTNQGESWEEIQFGEKNTIQEFQMFNKDYGLRSIIYYVNNKCPTYSTHNGGESWEPIQLPEKYQNFFVVYIFIIDINTLIMLIISEDDGYKFIRSDDNGITWYELVFVPHGSGHLQYINKDIGWMRAGSPVLGETGNVIYKTTDGGFSWKLLTDSNIYNKPIMTFRFYNETDGIAIGDKYYVVRTTDGGDSWFKETIFPFRDSLQGKVDMMLYDIKYFSPSRAYMTGLLKGSYGFLYKYQNSIEDVIDNTTELNNEIYPNPAYKGSQVYLNTNSIPGDKLLLKIYDIYGACTELGEFHITEYNQRLTIDLPENIGTGTYFISIIIKNKILFEKLLIVK